MSELVLYKKAYDRPIVQRIFSALVRKTGRTFGVSEALVFGRGIDFWMRYQVVLPELPDGLILDVGCGKLGMGIFIGEERTIALDITPEVRSATGHRIIASAGELPFRDGAVAAVAIVDSLAHLPRPVRESFVSASKKIAPIVIVHVPIWELCAETDKRFARTHKKLFGSPAPMNLEHALFGQPTFREMAEYFPGASLKPDQNRTVNYILFVLERLPVIGWLTGLIYLVFLRGAYQRPPYYSALFVWRGSS